MGQIIYPRFSEWEKRMVQTASGVLFAPEDFTIDYEIGRRCYFDWYEAVGFEDKVLRPNGWRLPTASELEEVVEEGYEFVFRELNLGLYGYISGDKMSDYRHIFSPAGSRYVSDISMRGHYWSSTSDTGSTAFAIGFGGSRLVKDQPAVYGYAKGYGRNIRCVRDI